MRTAVANDVPHCFNVISTRMMIHERTAYRSQGNENKKHHKINVLRAEGLLGLLRKPLKTYYSQVVVAVSEEYLHN
jgi:hypothetical protein